MAVYTEVSFDEASTFLTSLKLGNLLTLEGCSGGIENTNYFVTTDQAPYVLTLFERLSAEQLPFYLRLMKHLAFHGVPVPDPAANRDGDVLHSLNGKPAAVVNRLKGKSELTPGVEHCRQVGAMLARMHQAGGDFAMQQPNLRGLAWWVATAPQIQPFLTPPQQELLQTELAFQQQLAASPGHAELPRGPIHADLFRDNVMFEGERLSGLFDFYFAGVDTFLFDIAVCLNDWCIAQASGQLDEGRASAFVAAYDAQRRLTSDELQLLPAAMRAAALRFWISRLWDLHLPRDASVLVPHDPTHFERVLRSRVASPWAWSRTGGC